MSLKNIFRRAPDNTWKKKDHTNQYPTTISLQTYRSILLGVFFARFRFQDDSDIFRSDDHEKPDQESTSGDQDAGHDERKAPVVRDVISLGRNRWKLKFGSSKLYGKTCN